ncbi:MAG: 4-aminobutyrate--2-oxoglutarate transaminase [Bacteroidales bacterium]|nr:4-aminobutyrate--2-oxoglutarate transaminase [Bacteroidales bacterium]
MRSTDLPKLVTNIPGPKSSELIEIRNENVPVGVSSYAPVFAKSAKGALVEDVDGNVFLDFVGGIGVMNIGHSNPEVIEAIKEQVDKYVHTSINVVHYEQYIRLAEKINKIMPGDHKKKTMFVNSGAEAVENAIKIARKYTRRTEIVTFTGAFHGRTLLTMSLTSKVKPYKFGFGPFAPGVHRAIFPYIYRTPAGIAQDNLTDYYIALLNDFFLEEVAPDEVAAIIIEPVQGEAGFVVPPKNYITALRKICDDNGILLICDEVQTGFCRTGKFFAHEYWDVLPDIVTTAKSIGGGLPLSGVTAKAEIMEASHAGGIGGTYCGNPVATAAALKIIEIMERDNYVGKAIHIGEVVMKRFNEMKDNYAIIGDVRGQGAMLAIEFVKDRTTKEANKEVVNMIIKECWEHGLIILNAGVRGNIIRTLMPLIITDEQLEIGLQILEDAIKKYND